MRVRAGLLLGILSLTLGLHAPTRLLPRSFQSSASFHSRTTFVRAQAAEHKLQLPAQLGQPAPPTPQAKSWRRGVSGAVALSALLLLVGPSLALASGGATEHLHLGEKIALFFQKSGLPDWAVLMLISATPAVELRGGVPVGNWMGISPVATFIICVVGNMLPIAPVLLGLRSPLIKRLAAPLLERANKKLAGLPKGRSRELALALFVGVPAPGTGAWTGAIIAYLLDMPFAPAMGAILSGVLLAASIMTVLTLAGKAGALIALAALVVFGVSAILSASKTEAAE